MKPYVVIVHKDENSAYGMTFPDAPGCFSAADDLDGLFPMKGVSGGWPGGKAEVLLLKLRSCAKATPN